MENVRPTKKQKELLNFIDGFIKGYGYGPSYREIMRALDYKSVSTVATHVNGLITRGWLVKKDNSARSLVVMMPGGEVGESVVKKTTDDEMAWRVITAKITELQADPAANAEALAVLTNALGVLGYTDIDQKLS